MWVVGRLLGISYETAGYLLNSVFFTAASVFFVLVVHAFGGTTRRLISLAVLLAVLHPSFNEYRSFIIRDGGFLAFYLLGVLFLVRSVDHDWFPIFFLAALSFLVAGLFRIEGVVLFLCLPLLAWGVGKFSLRSSWVRVAITCLIIAILLIVAGWWLTGMGSPLNSKGFFMEPMAVIQSGLSDLAGGFLEKVIFLQTRYLPSYASHFAVVVVVIAAAVILAVLVISQLTVPCAVCVVVGRIGFSFRFVGPYKERLWLVLIGLHLSILSAFVLVQFFVTPRYPLALSMTFLVAIPFILNLLNPRRHWAALGRINQIGVTVLFIWALGESISGLDNATKAAALKDAGTWLGEKTTEPGSLLTNDRRVAYYAGRHNDRSSIEMDKRKMYFGIRKKRWPDSDWIAIRVRRDDGPYIDDFSSGLKKKPVKVFDAGAGDRVFIFKN